MEYSFPATEALMTASDRLVESPRLKKALELTYTGILPKGAYPFIYLR
jgi:DNA mismatch repair ATPase MutL